MPKTKATALDSVITYGRMRYDLQKGRVAEGNHLGAMQRSAKKRDVPGALHKLFEVPYENAMAELEQGEAVLTKHLEAAAKAHPVLSKFAREHKGIGPAGLGMIVAHVGPLDRFKSPGRLWAYCGFHVGDGGTAVRRKPGVLGNWNPSAKTILYRQAVAAVKAKGEYQDLYRAERKRIGKRPRVGPSGCPFGQTHTGLEREEMVLHGEVQRRRVSDDKRVRQCYRVNEEGKQSSAHVHAHCLRVVAKRLLKDLWCAWNPELVRDEPIALVQPTGRLSRRV